MRSFLRKSSKSQGRSPQASESKSSVLLMQREPRVFHVHRTLVFFLRMMSMQYNYIGGDLKPFFIFNPIPAKMIQFEEHIFQMGWFNHQLGNHFPLGVNQPASALGPSCSREDFAADPWSPLVAGGSIGGPDEAMGVKKGGSCWHLLTWWKGTKMVWFHSFSSRCFDAPEVG